MKAPKATPMVNQKNYTIKDNSDNCYKIKLTYLSDQLIIDIKQEDSFPQLNYSSTFILEEIKKNDEFFKLFNTFDDSMKSIDDLFEEKKVNVIRQDNNIKLILIHSEKNISDTTFVIKMKKEEEDDIIPELIESHNALIKRVKFLEESNKQMKEIIDKIMVIPGISKYIYKINKKFLDGIIKTEEDKNLIFSWINPDFKKISAKLIYSARHDGDDAKTFHNLCDKVHLPTLIIIETIDGKIFGGFTKESWEGNNEYKIDEKAFIFSLDNKQKAKLINKNYAIFCSTLQGPTFGAGHDLYICPECLNSRNSYSRLYSYKFEGNNSNNPFNIEQDNQISNSNFSNMVNSVPFSTMCIPNNSLQCKEVEIYAITENK